MGGGLAAEASPLSPNPLPPLPTRPRSKLSVHTPAVTVAGRAPRDRADDTQTVRGAVGRRRKSIGGWRTSQRTTTPYWTTLSAHAARAPALVARLEAVSRVRVEPGGGEATYLRAVPVVRERVSSGDRSVVVSQTVSPGARPCCLYLCVLRLLLFSQSSLAARSVIVYCARTPLTGCTAVGTQITESTEHRHSVPGGNGVRFAARLRRTASRTTNERILTDNTHTVAAITSR